MDADTRQLDLDDDSLTENTRGAYPLEFIDNSVPSGQAGHPRNIVMLTADAFGVLPPIARLSPAGAMYHFLSGYTAKVAGTEKGVTEPKATFSTCFGAPFMVLHPTVYAKFLGERIARHDARVWLVNTGWTGGPYGVGHAHEDRAHPRHDQRRALRRSSTTWPTRPIRSSTSTCRRPCPGVPARGAEAAQHLEGPGRLRRAGAQAGADVRRQLQDVRGGRRSGREGGGTEGGRPDANAGLQDVDCGLAE